MTRTLYVRGRRSLAIAAGALVLALPASVQAASQPASSGHRAVPRWGVAAQLARHAAAAHLAKAPPAAVPAVAVPVTHNAFIFAADTPSGSGLYLMQTSKDGVALPAEVIIAQQPNVIFTDPVISPDGTKVAYGKIVLTNPPTEQVLYRTIGSSTETALNPTSNPQCAPDWRDNTHILYTEDCDSAGSPSLVLVETSAGGTTSTLIPAAAFGRYHYDSAGAADKLAYVAVSGSSDVIATANADGTNRLATTVPGSYPSLSPEPAAGRIVYEYPKAPNGPDGIAVMNSDGTNVRPFTATASPTVDAVEPSWSDSGNEIYYTAANTSPAGNYDLFSVDPAGYFVANITQTDTVDEVPARFFGHIDPRVHGSQSFFTPVAPTRILDTRYRVGSCGPGIAPGAPVPSGGKCKLLVANGTIVPGTANAVVLNLTGISPTAATFLSVYPTTAANTAPAVSNLNLTPGQTAAVLVQVRLGTGTQNVGGSQVTIFNHSGTTHVAADVVGYFQADTAPTTGTYHPVAAKRIVDTRSTSHVGPCPTLGTNGSCTVDVTANSSGIPAGATAAVLNLTGIAPTGTTYLKVYPAGGSVPVVSNLNLGRGQIRANLATVKLGTGTSANKFVISNHFGNTNAAVDVAGWYDADGSGASYYPTPTPIRILDTRTAIKTVNGSIAPVGSNMAINVLASGYITTHAGLGFLPARPDAIAFNLTGVDPTASTYLSAYPSDATSPPPVSNVNLPAGSIVPNLAIVSVPTTTGWLKVFNHAGNTHVLMDLFGYYNTPPPTP